MGNQIKVYMSHAIRGKGGDDTPETVRSINCEAAKLMAGRIRQELSEAGLGNDAVELYVPAEHAVMNEIDYRVLKTCQACILYVPRGDEMTGGRLLEHDFAIDNMITTTVFQAAHSAVASILEDYNYANGSGVAMDHTGEQK